MYLVHLFLAQMLPAPDLAKLPAADPVKVSGFPKAEADLSIGACFGAFLRRVVPSHTAYGVARGVCDDVIAGLRAVMPHPDGATDYVITGAVGKRTALSPIRMADLLYILPPKFIAAGNGRAGDALKTVANLLAPKLAGVTVHGAGVIVPRGSLWVKVLPSAPHRGAFLIPGAATLTRASGWSISNPIAEAATLRLSDSLYGGRPRLMLTALKAWREASKVPISSFALELLVQDYYASGPRAFELDKALTEFWVWSRLRTPCKLTPPGAQSAVEIDTAWHGKAKAAYWRVTLAEHHLKTGKLIDAAVEWRQLLGLAFPVPGETPLKALPLFKK